MQLSQSLSRSLAVLCLAAIATCSVALAQPAKKYKPQVGQEGKDVVWVPTAQALVDKMLNMAKVTPNDYVIDLGSGDGRTVITAANAAPRRSASNTTPTWSSCRSGTLPRPASATRRTFVKADIFESDFSQATVLTLFLLPELNVKLRPTILEHEARHPRGVELVRHG